MGYGAGRAAACSVDVMDGVVFYFDVGTWLVWPDVRLWI